MWKLWQFYTKNVKVNLSSQLERWPPSNHICKLSQEPRSCQKKGRKRYLLLFFCTKFGENDVLGIILRCPPPREARLRLGSVAAALVDSLQQLNPGYVYKHIEKLDTEKLDTAYGLLPFMASSSGGVRYGLCVPNFFASIFFMRPT